MATLQCYQHNNNLVGLLNRVWWGGDPDIPDRISGLSRRDIYSVQKSWGIVYANRIPNGTEIFKRLFRADPETKRFFKIVADSDEHEIDSSIQFKAHVINFMTSLNQAVTNLHQPEIVLALMQKIGETHHARCIQRSHFDVFKDVMIKMLVEVQSVDDEAWSRVFDFWYKRGIFATLCIDLNMTL